MANDAWYVPELGQACFGQPWQPRPVPEHVEFALEALRYALLVLRPDESDPFGNTGAATVFDCPAFHVQAYDWNEEAEQECNFSWRDVRISWYKWCGRGMSINRRVSEAEAQAMLRECLLALIGKGEGEHAYTKGIRDTR